MPNSVLTIRNKNANNLSIQCQIRMPNNINCAKHRHTHFLVSFLPNRSQSTYSFKHVIFQDLHPYIWISQACSVRAREGVLLRTRDKLILSNIKNHHFSRKIKTRKYKKTYHRIAIFENIISPFSGVYKLVQVQLSYTLVSANMRYERNQTVRNHKLKISIYLFSSGMPF